MFTHKNGAKRGEERLRFDLIPLEAMEAYAERAGIGASKYGEFNWQKGDQQFFVDAINHAIYHLWCWLAGRLDDEKNMDGHLKAALWNIGSVIWARAKGKLKMWWE